MFGKKEKCPDPFKDKVKCTECKHYIDRADAQAVRVIAILEKTDYYCPTHKKPYQEERLYWSHGTMRYFALLEVDKTGNLIKTKKLTK